MEGAKAWLYIEVSKPAMHGYNKLVRGGIEMKSCWIYNMLQIKDGVFRQGDPQRPEGDQEMEG